MIDGCGEGTLLHSKTHSVSMEEFGVIDEGGDKWVGYEVGETAKMR